MPDHSCTAVARIYRTGPALAAVGLLAWYKWLRGENPRRGNQQLWAFIVLVCGVSAGILLCDGGSFLANFVHPIAGRPRARS